MGRETKLLLGLLAMLAGVFMGVLSMKLLVRRPPPGAGPDVHVDFAATQPADLVEPPQYEPRPAPRPAGTEVVADASDRPPSSRFAPPRPQPEADAPPVRMDPLVAAAAFAQPLDPAAAPPAVAAAGEPEPVLPQSTVSSPSALPPGAYVARAGDSWWSLAERTYGDGRLYRALFAWNRSIDPRVSLVPGTPIEIPPAERLQAAWPALLPRH